MYLTGEEQQMLDGKFGEGVSIAMKVLVAVGEAFGAERMVEITRSHVALSNQEADLWFVEKLVKAGATCRVSPTVNPGFNLEYFQQVKAVDRDDEEIIKRTRAAYKTIGATLTYNCTPYLEKNIPRFGEITAFSESSATPYINSVYGARTNREAAQSALCASVAGRVPLYGLLLDENRRGQVLVEVQAKMESDFDYNMLGYCAPKKIGFGVPVFTGLPIKTSPEALMNLGAQLNTAGAVSLYHIVGVTPEAPTIEAAFHGEDPEKRVVITEEDIKQVRDVISAEAGKIDFALFGCPHLTINQVAKIARMLEGKKLAVELWVCTSSLTKELAKRMGYLGIINRAGGHIVEDTCIDQPCWQFLYGKKGVTDSPKCAYYTERRNMDFVIRSISECIEAAIKGEVK
ncbi:predicted aconitase subunit 1 [Desulfotomaculum arcticum]|uniref:Predicted aconitase subunit 1 n=1 Tax=Desulfotruncus arcticus DSM 17038 TaxID=1121424 RepID=A0A1I2ZQC5_9FIRM|nr:aconitase X catalytic domain-containing protein [Desulfotruncus arcticus]SFH40057.1 predicted aconitase subunit 1 [Desulfotomaculum arcticum] [Desulfotruncus arcticus DSM 17038]